MRISLSQSMVQICSVCKQVWGSSEGDVEVALFGAAAYVVCPCCNATVKNHHNKAYRKRADEWVKEQSRV